MRNDSSPPLDNLARAVLDGTPIDWLSVESSAKDEAERSLIRQLRLLSEIAEIHRHPSGPAGADPLVATAATLAPPLEDWGHFRLLDRVGHGAYGDVYRARDSRLDREVALKLLARDSTNDGFASSMIHEGRLLARVRHPNVVTIYDADRIEGRVGLWMEFVHGRTLAQAIREQGTFQPAEVIPVGIALCDALSAVHEAGLLHRDIKAQNVMQQDDGRLVLMDFGTGRDVQDGATPENDIAGTPLYLSPELFAGEAASVQSDIYSLGVLLFHLATASFPVKGRTVQELRDAHLRGERTSLQEANPIVPEGLARIVDRALAINRNDRFESAQALAAELRTLARPAPASRWGLWAGVLAVAATSTIVGVGVRRWNSGPPARQESSALSSPRARQLNLPDDVLMLGMPSPDGRYFPYSEASRGNLVLLETENGIRRVLTNAEEDFREYANGGSVVSADSREVAYSWQGRECDCTELRTIGADGGTPRVLVRDRSVEDITPFQWSEDGRHIVASIARKNDSYQLALISTADGSIHVWKTLGAPPNRASLSPDGRHLAYDALSREDGKGRDIYMLSEGGSQEATLVESTGEDAFPMWTPDGGSLLFMSDRSGTFGLWRLPMGSGFPQGPPDAVNKDMGRIFPITLTKDGALFYDLQNGMVDVYTATLDLPNARVVGSPSRGALKYFGSNISSDWSPDGESLAFVSIRKPFGYGSRALVLRSFKTGQERDLTLDLGFFMTPRWSPDGRSILVRGDRNGQAGLYRVDARRGTTLQTLWTHPHMFGGVEWGTDSRRIFYQRENTVRERLLKSGKEREVYRAPQGTGIGRGLAVSHDGRWIAFTLWHGRESSLHVAPVDGGQERALLSVQEPLVIEIGSWTADDLHLLFTRLRKANDSSWGPGRELWTIPSSGGEPRSLGLKMDGLREIRANVDGRRIAFTDGSPELRTWVMENFLSGAFEAR